MLGTRDGDPSEAAASVVFVIVRERPLAIPRLSTTTCSHREPNEDYIQAFVNVLTGNATSVQLQARMGMFTIHAPQPLGSMRSVC